MTLLHVCLENNVDGFHSDATVKRPAQFSCHLIVIMFSRYSCSSLMFLNEPKSSSSQRQGGKEGHPGLTALICLRSGIWSECMFAFYYASTTNPFYWESSLPSCSPLCDSQVLELKLYPPEVKGDWVTLVSGSVGAKSVAINTHRLVWGVPQSAFST